MTGPSNVLADIPAPPCELHTCAQSRRCALELLACEAFAQYARSGRWSATASRKPNRALFRMVFTKGEAP